MELQHICECFNVQGDFVNAEALTEGNINTTYLVTYRRDGKDKPYIVQKINKFVFKNPELVMENITNIAGYIRNKIKETQQTAKRNVLHYMFTTDNISYYLDKNNDYWRCYRYIDDTITVNNTNDLYIIEQAGMAFGQFQNCLCDFDASVLHISIPDFHNTKKRFDDFINSVNLDKMNRAASVKEEIDYLLSCKEEACKLCNMLDSGVLPLKVTHNDTKCNNVLFDKVTHEALAVIDLDTVMPGLTAYDYGDAIRSIASTTTEDEVDLTKVDLDMDKFKAFTKGFLIKVGASLTESEIESLGLGIFTMTIELASRFLKDYLDGDVYFKSNHDGHNLERTRCQIALAKQIAAKKDIINMTISDYTK